MQYRTAFAMAASSTNKCRCEQSPSHFAFHAGPATESSNNIPCARQRRPYRRRESDSRKRMVCSSSVRHERHLQDLCRELPWRGSFATHSGRRRTHGHCRSGSDAAQKSSGVSPSDYKRSQGGVAERRQSELRHACFQKLS